MTSILDYNPTTNGQIILVEKSNQSDSIILDEIKNLFRDYEPFEYATEKLFAMFSDDRIQLRYEFSQTFLLRYNKNFATCYIQGIPIEYNLHVVYNTFRKFGPVYKCQRLTAPSQVVMVHYYSIKHRDQALQVMHQYILPDDIQISVVCSSSSTTTKGTGLKKKRPASLKLQPSKVNTTPPPSSINYSPSIFVMNHSPFHHYSHTPYVHQEPYLKTPSFEIKPSMDLCNLYVKGIQPGSTSTDLFNLFKPFGRIISAKVMESNTGASGFGFVSYSSSTEAAKALISMNTKDEIKNTSPIMMVVRFHEPRVLRLEHNYNYQVGLLSRSALYNHFYIRKGQSVTSLRQAVEPVVHVPVVTPSVHVHHQPYCYYTPYWTHQGLVCTNFIRPVASSTTQPTTRQATTQDSIPNKLIQVLKHEYKITEQENGQVLEKILKKK
ncbi:hypothetical protein HPULCUR_010444 [Helicostylum pulchrum]|uniref:RRM domain-containing protein n=1 Tax=Helicostylum pulchrum TaxID=562976 RepID=A0ABP9YDA3_9FUNG